MAQLTVTPVEYTDLYWALSGGGGRDFTILLLMTIRAYRQVSSHLVLAMFDINARAGHTRITHIPSQHIIKYSMNGYQSKFE
jgi:hypothetical protein